MVLPQLSQTEYASLAAANGAFHLACYHRESAQILMARSRDGENWEAPEAFPTQWGQARFPSLAAAPDGSQVLAFTLAGKTGIWLSVREAGGDWTEPKAVCEMTDEKLGKPKLSVDSTGAMWISAQTDHWGSYEKCFHVDVHEQSPVEIEIRPTGGAGNAMWTLNEIDFRNRDGVSSKCLRFGPEPEKAEPNMDYVSARTWQYDAPRGCGFDAPVEELLRELGSPVTRRLVFSPDARRLRVDLAPGSYKMKVTHSSWIASRPGLEVHANVPCVPDDTISPKADEVYFFRGTSANSFQCVAATPQGQEHNRPGAACETGPGRYQLAWTSFASEAVEIVTQNIEFP